MNFTDDTTTGGKPAAKAARCRRCLAVAAGMAVALMAAAASGQQPPAAPAARPATAPAAASPSPSRVELMVNKTTVIATRAPYSRVSVGQPDVADVTPIGPTNLLVTAKKAGTTQIIVWDDQERTQTFDVDVSFDLDTLGRQLRELFPNTAITTSSANGSVMLRGTVPSLQVSKQAEQIATAHSGRVLNMLEVAGGQQVVLAVKFAEVSRTATNALGVNFGFTDGVGLGGSNAGGVAPFSVVSLSQPDTLGLGVSSGSSSALFGRAQIGGTAVYGFIQALRQNSLLRVLAEPNLVAMSGEEASFLAGGEFPIPVPQQGGAGAGTITITYKEFGVRLKFVPVVLGDGNIRMRIEPEVSDLDFANAVSVGGFPVPGLRTRRLSTTVEVADGQSLALAGLLNDSTFTRKEQVPGLGDIPVLGALFRSTRFERRETELVVLVTPHLVAPMNPNEVPPLPGERWRRPNSLQLFFGGDLGGSVEGAARSGRAPTAPPPPLHGSFGFTEDGTAGATTVTPATDPMAR